MSADVFYKSAGLLFQVNLTLPVKKMKNITFNQILRKKIYYVH